MAILNLVNNKHFMIDNIIEKKLDSNTTNNLDLIKDCEIECPKLD